MKFCYVLLHYKTDEDTTECIRSIFKVEKDPLIVVVDNASENGSIEKVEEEFQGFSNIHIIKNKENIGFAAGNNVGYKYARNTLNADFIAISNNDITVVTQDFSKRVEEIYEKTGFDVLGPDIISLVDGGHQNPMEESFHSAGEVRKEIKRYKMLLTISRMGIYDILKSGGKVRTGSARKDIPDAITEGIMLHGSFVVFSPSFIKKEQIAFREGTFLYVEEAILKHYCDNTGYKMIFAPDICVRHKEDSATNSIRISNRERREFVFRNMIQSLSVYLEYFND